MESEWSVSFSNILPSIFSPLALPILKVMDTFGYVLMFTKNQNDHHFFQKKYIMFDHYGSSTDTKSNQLYTLYTV